MKTTIHAVLAVVLTLTAVTTNANNTTVQQQLNQQTQQLITRIEQQSGRYLTFEQANRVKLNLMAEQLIKRYPMADMNTRLTWATIDYQLEDISQQRQLMINLQVLEDDGDGVIPP